MAVLAHLFGLVSSQYLPDFHTWRELRLKVLCFRADGYMAFSKFTGRYSFTAKPKFCCSTSTETRHGRLGSDGLCLGRWHLILQATSSWWSPIYVLSKNPDSLSFLHVFRAFSACLEGPQVSKTVCSLKTSAFAGLLSGLAADPMTSWQKAGKTTLLYRCLSKLNYVLDCPVELCVENHIIRPMHSETHIHLQIIKSH